MKWKIIKNVSESPSILDDKKNSFFIMSGKTFITKKSFLASLLNDNHPAYENK